jgi:hypothetical protein
MTNTYRNVDILAYHANKHHLSLKESELIFEKLKLFLQESLDKNGNEPTPDVDLCWHSFILHTEEYYNYCAKYLGKFIHHYPHYKEQELKVGDVENFECKCDAGSKALDQLHIYMVRESFECGCETGTRPINEKKIY